MIQIPIPPVVDVNLWEPGAVDLEDLREIVAMLLDMTRCKVVREVGGKTLWVEQKR